MASAAQNGHPEHMQNVVDTGALQHLLMDSDMGRLFGRIQWLMDHRHLMRLGAEMSQLMVQYAMAAVLTPQTLEQGSRLLKLVGVNVEPVTVGAIAQEVAQEGVRELRAHPMESIRKLEDLVARVNTLSAMDPLDPEDAKHRLMAQAVTTIHHIPTLLKEGERIYDRGSHWLKLAIPDALAVVHRLQNSGPVHVVEAAVAKELGAAHEKWRHFGVRNKRLLHLMRGEIQAAMHGDASDDEEGHVATTPDPIRKAVAVHTGAAGTNGALPAPSQTGNVFQPVATKP